MTGPSDKSYLTNFNFKLKSLLNTSHIRPETSGILSARLQGDSFPRAFKNMPAFKKFPFAITEIDPVNTTISDILLLQDVSPGPEIPFEQTDFGDEGEINMINVINDFGADNTGTNNTTAAIQAAVASARAGEIIYFPAGTYLITPDTINFGAKRICGDYSHPIVNTTIKAASTGTSLVFVNSTATIENMVFDADNKAQIGVDIGVAHGSFFQNIIAVNALDWGITIDRAIFTCLGMTANFCMNGIYLDSPNGSILYGLSAANCQRVGIEVRGVNGGGAQSGQCQIFGLVVDVANIEGGYPQIRINGVDGIYMWGAYVEGNGDHLLIEGNTINSAFNCMRFVGGDGGIGSKAVRIRAGRNIFVSGCSAPQSLSDSIPDFASVYIHTTASANVAVVGCARNSNSAIDPFGYILDNDLGTVEKMLVTINGQLRHTAAPTIGTWQDATVVWNRGSGTGAPGNPKGGWRRTSTGTWVEFG